MTPRDLMLKIVKAYQDARIPRYADLKIRRGRSHPISSLTEDLFAAYLISNDSTIDAVYVDQPIHFKDAKKQIYPDLTIVRNGVISSFIDIKMDLGWKRDGLFDLCKRHQEMVKKIQGVECDFRDGATKNSSRFRVAEDASYDVVIISGRNINPALLHTQLEQAKSLAPDLEVFVLCDRGHPNAYGIDPETLVDKLDINQAEFDRLRTKVLR